MTTITEPFGIKFTTGKLLITTGVAQLIQHANLDIDDIYQRHIACDWSDMAEMDRIANTDAIREGDRIFSAFKLDETCLKQIENAYGELISDKVYVITEADRSHTTILLPIEY
ncbi:hypothetical protein HF888_16440 (plasmid) [Bermanella marisrubri]|uniref:Uncharacterized protein n=1 Tax=Bermanella marisrubri TaxID=207949 RepID=Q1MY20_9GAMM|nr:hypothetical protein [Bermanella marisrubri]EAT10876.1 hypothetical protein RED65_02018 [Oceanobacter sp. RED65] [Bermanella marisrubri]QIZ85929.1 hypothetical protein HF888_16440 [Bermanella marisrubri]